MTDEQSSGTAARPSLLDIAFDRFHRVVAALCLLFGVLYWIRLIGFYPGSVWRFDLMPLHWQIISAALAVLFPFAAVGLWLVASWGPVIWFVCAAIEIIVYGFYQDVFGPRNWAIALHLAVGLCYVGFRAALHFRHRRTAEA